MTALGIDVSSRDPEHSHDFKPSRVMPAIICEAVEAERLAIIEENKAIDRYTEYCFDDPEYEPARAAYQKAFEHRQACTARLLDLRTQYHAGTLTE